MKPKYNILKIAGSRFGIEQTKKAKQSISKALKGRIFSVESKVKMQEVAKLHRDTKTYFYNKSHTV